MSVVGVLPYPEGAKCPECDLHYTLEDGGLPYISAEGLMSCAAHAPHGSASAPTIAAFIDQTYNPVGGITAPRNCTECTEHGYASDATHYLAPNPLCSLHASMKQDTPTPVVLHPFSFAEPDCSEHDGVARDTYCRQCEVLECENCTVNHDSHKAQLVSTGKARDELIEGPAGLVATSKVLEAGHQSLEVGLGIVRAMHADIASRAADAEALIAATIEELVRAIYTRRDALLEQVRAVRDTKQSQLAAQDKSLKRRIALLQQVMDTLQAAINTGNPICMSKTLREAKRVQQQARAFAGTVVTGDLEFRPAPSQERVKAEIAIFGHVLH